MKAKRIILAVSSNLETDQRVHKVATHFHEQGWDVLVVGTNNKTPHPYRQPYPTKRLKLWFKKGPLFFAETNLRMFFFILFKKADRIWGNDTDVALATFLASKIKRTDYSLDLHELFPELPEVTHRKFVKKCWTMVDDFVIPRTEDCYTVCQSIAQYHLNRYGKQITVLRNVPFPKPFRREKIFGDIQQRIILYQGALNDGRGIDWVIRAMPKVDNAIFVIIGKGDKEEELKALAKELALEEKVRFLGFVPFQELIHYTNSADLGVCLLEEKGLSYYYALPNRIFDFMHAHVPILATDFPEIRRVVDGEHTGRVISHYEPDFLAQTINEMLAEPIDHAQYEAATQRNNWEVEKKVIRM